MSVHDQSRQDEREDRRFNEEKKKSRFHPVSEPSTGPPPERNIENDNRGNSNPNQNSDSSSDNDSSSSDNS